MAPPSSPKRTPLIKLGGFTSTETFAMLRFYCAICSSNFISVPMPFVFIILHNTGFDVRVLHPTSCLCYQLSCVGPFNVYNLVCECTHSDRFCAIIEFTKQSCRVCITLALLALSIYLESVVAFIGFITPLSTSFMMCLFHRQLKVFLWTRCS